MPTGPESKVALYEAAEHLDNNGQTTGDPAGRLRRHADLPRHRAPRPPSTDRVGPVSSHIAARAEPVRRDAPSHGHRRPQRRRHGGFRRDPAEFVVDDAVTTGAGFGAPMAGTFGTGRSPAHTGPYPRGRDDLLADHGRTASGAELPVRRQAHRLRPGTGLRRQLGRRRLGDPQPAQDRPATTNGSLADSPANGAVPVDVSATGDDSAAGGTITDAEYFIDTVAADGTGTAMTRNRTATVVSEDGTFTAAMSTVSPRARTTSSCAARTPWTCGVRRWTSRWWST